MQHSTEGQPFEVAVLGYGLAGAVLHAPLIHAVPGLRLGWVVTRDVQRRATVRTRYPDAVLLDSADDLWVGSHRPDLVVVATPSASHTALARDALNAGCHVVVDKPFALHAQDAREIVDLAERVHRLAIPFQNRRWDGDFLTVRRLVADGTLGQVHRFESRMERWRPVAKPRWTQHDARREGEGVVYDLGSHLVDQALTLFGPARTVWAQMARCHEDVQVEDDAFIAIVHESGTRSHLSMSTAAAQPGPRMSLFGSRAAYLKSGADVQEDALRAGRLPGGAGWGEEPRSHWGTVGAGSSVTLLPTLPGDYLAFYEGVVRALRRDGPPPVVAVDAIASLEVIEAAFLAQQQGRVVACGETCASA